jgi:hypothetical protein
MTGERVAPSKSFMILGGITLVAVLVAAFIVVIENADRTLDFEGRVLFPELSYRINDVARITIETKDQTFDVVRDADGVWSLPGKGGYSPALSPLRLTVQGMASLKLTEAKTARADMHAAIGLKSPSEDGEGVLIGLYSASDETLALLLVGNTQGRGRGSTPNSYYVRLPESNQTWLAQSILDVKDEETDWIETSLFKEVVRDDIQSVSVTPLEGPAYLLERYTPESPDFLLGFVPEGRAPKAAFNLNTTAYALAGLSITDVKPAAEIDFGDAARATYRLFNGLVLDLELLKQDEAYWVSFIADAKDPLISSGADDHEPAPERELDMADSNVPSIEDTSVDNQALASRITARTDGWAFRIAEFKFNQFTKSLDSLLEPRKEETESDTSEDSTDDAPEVRDY